MPVGGGNDGLAGSYRVRQGPRDHLCLVSVWSNVDISRTDEFHQLLGDDETVVKDDLRFHSQFPGQSLQVGSILFAFAAKNMGVGRPGDDVDNIAISVQDSR